MTAYNIAPRSSSRAKLPANTAPVDFDPTTHPIIALHWFGVKPLHPIGAISAEVVADLQFRRQVQRLHRLGPRVTGEFLAEIGAERSITTIIDRKLDTYAELDPNALEATGGDDFWPAPLHEVRRTP